MKELFLTIALFVAVLSGANSTFSQSRAKLFEIREVPSAKLDKTSPASVRESEIGFDSLSLSQAETLEIPLFDGKTYSAKRFQTETRAMNDYTWRGKITEGKFEGDVILTFRKGFVSGLIFAPNEVYEIVPRGAKQILVKLEQELFPECGGEVKSEEIPNNTNRENTLATTD